MAYQDGQETMDAIIIESQSKAHAFERALRELGAHAPWEELGAKIISMENENDVCYYCGWDNGPIIHPATKGTNRNGWDCGWCGSN